MIDFLQTLNSAANQRAREWRENLPQILAQPNLIDPQGRQTAQPLQPRRRDARTFQGWLQNTLGSYRRKET